MFARLRHARNLGPTLRKAHSLYEQGRLAEAGELYQTALRLDPGHDRALYNFGLVQMRSGRLDEALGHFSKAIEQNPDFAEAHNAAGIALRMSGRNQEAIAHYQKSLAIKPGYAEAENNLGLALRELEHYEEAAAHHRKALALKPDYPEAENNLGAALAALGRYEEAATHYRKAVSLRPDFAEAYSNLGIALQPLDRHDDALAQFDKALALKPDLAEAHYGRGIALKTLGRLEEGRRAVETAVDLAPRKAEFFGSLVQSKLLVDGDPHRVAIEALARDMVSLPEVEQIHLHFALGRVYADLGQYERSFRHLVDGNALKRRRVAYDEAAALGEIERIRASFGAEPIRRGTGLGDPSPVPVFIVGMPRSGTTLVEQILASHLQVHGGGERRDFEVAIAGLDHPAGDGRGLAPGRRALCRAGSGLEARSGAHHRQDAGQFSLRRPDPSGPAQCPYHPCPPRSGRHLSFVLFDSFRRHLPYAYDLGELGRYYRAYASLMAHWRAVFRTGSCSRSNTRRWSPISSRRRGASSAIAASTGTMPASTFTGRNGRCGRQVPYRCGGRSTTARLVAPGLIRECWGRCLRRSGGMRSGNAGRTKPTWSRPTKRACSTTSKAGRPKRNNFIEPLSDTTAITSGRSTTSASSGFSAATARKPRA